MNAISGVGSNTQLSSMIGEVESEVSTLVSTLSSAGSTTALGQEISNLESEFSGILSALQSDLSGLSTNGTASSQKLTQMLQLIEQMLNQLTIEITPLVNNSSLFQVQTQAQTVSSTANASLLNALA